MQADVSSADDAARLVAEAGDVDILINNAGLTRDGLLARMSDDDWRTVIETNLSSVFYTCRAVCRPMMKKRAGSIVNISSIVGVHGNWGQTNYAASKAGIIGFTKRSPASSAAERARERRCARLCEDAAHRRTARRGDGGHARLTPLGGSASPRTSQGRTLPLLRRGRVHHGRGTPRRRRAQDVEMNNGSDNGRRRVVITGMGAVRRSETTWRRAGGSCSQARRAPERSRSRPHNYKVHFACEVKDFDATNWIVARKRGAWTASRI